MKALKIRFISDFPTYSPIPDGKGSWVSNQDLIVESERIGTFTIPAGSHNNLASIPKLVRSVITVNGPHRIAAIVHDYLYTKKGSLPERNVSRKEADDVFFDVMRMSRNEFYNTLSHPAQLAVIRNKLERRFLTNEPLVHSITAHTMWSAVRAGGWIPWG